MQGHSSIPSPAPASGAAVSPALAPVPPPQARPGTDWRLKTVSGRLVEISGAPDGAALSLLFRLVLEAQRAGEPVAWVGRDDSSFHPPDVADAGVDLAALPVVWAGDALTAGRAADLLVRSGAFGLVVIDLGAKLDLPVAVLTRLAALAQKHDTAVACLTDKPSDRPSLSPLVSLRAHARRVTREHERFRCEAHAVKDKRAGPGWRHAEVCRGPDGLR